MKIRIEDPCGYEGLQGATFPLILDAKLGDKGACLCAILNYDASGRLVVG